MKNLIFMLFILIFSLGGLFFGFHFRKLVEMDIHFLNEGVVKIGIILIFIALILFSIDCIKKNKGVYSSISLIFYSFGFLMGFIFRKEGPFLLMLDFITTIFL